MQQTRNIPASPRRFASLAGAALLGIMGPAVHAQEASPQPPEPDTAAAGEPVIEVTAERDEDKVEVCRSAPITGTRFRERICSTREERRQETAATRDMINDHRYEGAPIIEDVEGMEGVPAIPPV